MSFNFPDTPTPGQTFEPTAGVVYVWTPPVWTRQIPPEPWDADTLDGHDSDYFTEEAPNDGTQYVRQNQNWAPVTVPPGTIVADTPPADPGSGQIWFESDTGNTYLWYVDANSAQWVQMAGALPDNASPARTAESRNRVINGAMQISQEWGNTAGGPTGAMSFYAADQWQGNNVTTGTCTFQRVQVVTPKGSKDRLRLTVNTADTSLGAGEYQQITQTIEGLRVADFQYGTASAKQMVLRFGFKALAGTYSISICNSPANRSYIANFTIAVGQANADTEQVIIIPGDTTGTWATDTGAGLSVRVVIAAGSTYQGTAGWNAGNFLGTAANTNGLATAGNVFELYDVGLYLDPNNTGKAPEWTLPDYAQELAACQRYWARMQVAWTGYTGGVAGCWARANLPVPMRTTAACSGVNNSNGGVIGAAVGTLSNTWGTVVQDARNSTGAGNSFFATDITASARM